MSAATAWKWMPATLLILTVVFAAWRVDLALSDPHFAAVEDAYGQASGWDAHMEEVRASRALGWQVRLQPAAIGPEEVQEVRFLLQDAADLPLTGVEGEFVAYHNAYPKERVRRVLEEREAGTYAASLPLTRAGIWNWEFRLRRGEQVWVGHLQEIVDAPVVGGSG